MLMLISIGVTVSSNVGVTMFLELCSLYKKEKCYSKYSRLKINCIKLSNFSIRNEKLT